MKDAKPIDFTNDTSIPAHDICVKSGGRDDCARVPGSSNELSVLAQRHVRLHLVLTGRDWVQAQRVDTGLGTLAKISFDSLAKSIYTLSDEGEDQSLYA